MLYTRTVEPRTFELLKKLMDLEVLKDFYLVGGTALALQKGHRFSIDLDLFTPNSFDNEQLIEKLKETFDSFILKSEGNQLIFAEIDNVPNKHWTNRPGWHDGMYVYPDPHREQEIMFRADKSVRVKENNRGGDIETLQETLKPLQYSSRIVLAIGLAFVAYLLRLLNLPPIAAIFYGRSSRGKSILQYAAASISGTIGIKSNGGLVSFASSETAIEEFIKGSNDDSLHVDELGSSGLSDKDLSKAMTRIAFGVALLVVLIIGLNRKRKK